MTDSNQLLTSCRAFNGRYNFVSFLLCSFCFSNACLFFFSLYTVNRLCWICVFMLHFCATLAIYFQAIRIFRYRIFESDFRSSSSPTKGAFVKSQKQFMIITQRFRVCALWRGYCCHTVGLFVALSAFVSATVRRLWFELRGDSNANFTNLKRFFRISISQLKHDRKLTLLYADSISAK